MRVEFAPNDGTQPANKLAEAELIFEEGPLAGLKLVGFAVWGGPEGQTYCTLPSRAFGSGQDRRYFDYIRSVDGDHRETRRVKDMVLAAWKARQGEEA